PGRVYNLHTREPGPLRAKLNGLEINSGSRKGSGDSAATSQKAYKIDAIIRHSRAVACQIDRVQPKHRSIRETEEEPSALLHISASIVRVTGYTATVSCQLT